MGKSVFGTQYQVNTTSPRDIVGKSVFGTQYQVNATSPRDIAGKSVFGTQYQVNATSPRDSMKFLQVGGSWKPMENKTISSNCSRGTVPSNPTIWIIYQKRVFDKRLKR